MGDNTGKVFEELLKLCKKLRGKDGCLWDKEQTHKSLIPYLKEESMEVIECIEKDSPENLKEELGDLLYQVIFHSQIASEKNEFTMEDVIKGLIDKLKRRHPHVFGDTEVTSVEDILKNWEKIKKSEKI